MNKHLQAITAGQVTKTNIIGIRKALNNMARVDRGLGTSRTAPKLTADDCDAIMQAIYSCKPLVDASLTASGKALLQNRRYAKRFTDGQRAIIADVQSFRLVDFDWIDNYHTVPVYQAIATGGASITFYNIPWQSGGDGPQIVAD